MLKTFRSFKAFEALIRDAELAICLMGKTGGGFEFELVEITGPPSEETLRGLVERGMCRFLGVTGIAHGKIRTQLAEPLELDAIAVLGNAVTAHWISGVARPKTKNDGVQYLTRLYALDARKDN